MGLAIVVGKGLTLVETVRTDGAVGSWLVDDEISEQPHANMAIIKKRLTTAFPMFENHHSIQ
jgi:hypothetical protein